MSSTSERHGDAQSTLPPSLLQGFSYQGIFCLLRVVVATAVCALEAFHGLPGLRLTLLILLIPFPSTSPPLPSASPPPSLPSPPLDPLPSSPLPSFTSTPVPCSVPHLPTQFSTLVLPRCSLPGGVDHGWSLPSHRHRHQHGGCSRRTLPLLLLPSTSLHLPSPFLTSLRLPQPPFT